jgi:hypothetical protein
VPWRRGRRVAPLGSAEGSTASGGEGDYDAEASLQGRRFTEGDMGDLRPREKEEGSELPPMSAEGGKSGTTHRV